MIIQWGSPVAGILSPSTLLLSGQMDVIGHSSALVPGLIATGITCMSFATGAQADVAMASGVQASLSFATALHASITFGEGSCQ